VTISRTLFVFLASSFVLTFASAQSDNAQNVSGIPHLSRQGSATHLIVNGKPLLMLAGETGNSSVSDLEYMNTVWPKIVAMHLNTLVVPVYWELVEPKEGEFNFTLVDSTIVSARLHNIKLVFLWFGTWKNSMSCYVPLWIKTDENRFPRARQNDGRAEEILTAFNNTNRNADARAFAALMKHIRSVDEQEQTVVLVQVENEIGMIPDARDHSERANEAFKDVVPEKLLDYLKEHKDKLNPELRALWGKNGFKTKGTWEEIFGKGPSIDELFMAWYYGQYANYVAEAGKKEYPLPMYVNAALIRPGYKPGQYPSAGPLPHLFDVWRPAAPDIDFFSPDIYFPTFVEWATKYDRPDNPLFIPEVGNNQSLANAFYAFGQLNAMGYSPFSIESLDHPEDNQVSKAYDVLAQLSPLILANQGKGTMAGVVLDSASQIATIKLGKYVFTVRHEYSWPYARHTEGENPRFGGIIIMTGPDEYYVAGRGLVVTFGTSTDDGTIAGIGSLDEGSFADGTWIPGLRMNGDQSHQGRHLDLPGSMYSIQKVRLYKYK
jgi:beta-galactosidase GanA